MNEQNSNIKKFGMLNINKKEVLTHAELQKNEVLKRGGRPKKDDKDKLKVIVSLNVNSFEKEILESESKFIGLNVVSLIRMSLSQALKNDFVPISLSSNNLNNEKKLGKVVKQYAVPVTDVVKQQLEDRANEYMISVSDLLKMSLRISGYYNI